MTFEYVTTMANNSGDYVSKAWRSSSALAPREIESLGSRYDVDYSYRRDLVR